MAHEGEFDDIESAIEDIRQGKVVIVVDDEDRENEGDFLTAARNATPEVVNFMATHGRGLICAPLTEQRCAELGLDLMVRDNTALHETPFTVSVDVRGHGTTTGISAYDRAQTMRALIDPATVPADLARPGHIFPLKARDGGVLRRTGHTEAAVDLARLAGLEPAGMIVEILNEDGSMARLPELRAIARRFNLKLITIEALVAYRMRNERLVERVVDVDLPTDHGDFKLIAYKQRDNGEEHLALVKGEWSPGEPVLVRVHSSCVTGDIFGSQRCDCGPQLHAAMELVERAGKGVVLYMHQEGRGIGLINKLKAYKLQQEGVDTVEANRMLGFDSDARDYGIGAQILFDLGVRRMKLMTNNPRKRTGLVGYGLEITETVPLEVIPNAHNKHYLLTKKLKLGHSLSIGTE
ncbi:MAG: bifunctional 3,4-dihydroxy-2-butanone-4-phosphate synthase/GTP cyclohydrolase II [Bacteroidetes bacterium]|nr:bifunctional 3,4-dihydroxy-2-butanone-4-phosphate synthase/GTP cyclohydrolase II [Bacteroidota bacterium]MCC6654032.1 bifunctional 3,4-dihydroxy-2-butanone-4-phosphate synthase/GTP cyclohydrolase II [Flavobacteriales bacterium]HMU14886.1 bifunctional 3,4-dihydroxy-2-butanone-4-phosphate synthase/GTP cyclohydrolase II [Flavobacteriales bacterium]